MTNLCKLVWILVLAVQALICISALPTPCRVEKTEGKTPLCLLLLLPYPDPDANAVQPSWDAGPDIVPAAELAVELINNNDTILKDYVIGLARDDCGCDIVTKATTSFTRSILSKDHDSPIAGIVGPGCSSSTSTVLPLSGRPEIALLTIHTAGSPQLESRELYPYGYSLLDSTYRGVLAVSALMYKARWTKIAALYEESRLYFQSTFQALEGIANTDLFPQGGEISFSAGVSPTYMPVGIVKRQLLRVIVVFAGPSLVKRLVCLGYQQYNLVFPTYQWIFLGRSLSEIDSGIAFTYNGQNYNCSRELMVNIILRGSLVLNYGLEPHNTTAATVSGLSFDEYQELYNERVQKYNANQDNLYVNITYDVWATTVFDAIWALALAMDKSNISLSEYSFGNSTATDMIRNEITRLKFDGVSGTVHFDNMTGFTIRVYNIRQVIDGDAIAVAYVEDNHLVRVGSIGAFIDDSFGTDLVTIHPAVAAIMILFITVQLVVVVVTHVLTVAYRAFPSVKASSPRLNQLSYVGTYLLIIALCVFAINGALSTSDSVYAVLCQLLWPWLLSPGFTLIFVPIIVRTWRLYRIFTHFMKPGGLFLSEPALFTVAILFLVPDAIFAVIWTAVDPFESEVVDEEIVDTGEGHTIIQTRGCTCEYYFVWFGLVYGYKILLVVVTVTLSQLTRNITNPNFTTKTLRILVYVFAFTFMLGGGLYYIFALSSSNVYSSYVILCLVINIFVLICIVLVFFPPLLPLLREKLGYVSLKIQ